MHKEASALYRHVRSQIESPFRRREGSGRARLNRDRIASTEKPAGEFRPMMGYLISGARRGRAESLPAHATTREHRCLSQQSSLGHAHEWGRRDSCYPACSAWYRLLPRLASDPLADNGLGFRIERCRRRLEGPMRTLEPARTHGRLDRSSRRRFPMQGSWAAVACRSHCVEQDRHAGIKDAAMSAMGAIHGGKRRFGRSEPDQVAALWRGRWRDDALRNTPNDSG